MRSRKKPPSHFPYLNARDGEIRDLKLDPDGWLPFHLLLLHTGEAKVGTHQVLFAPLRAHGGIRHTKVPLSTPNHPHSSRLSRLCSAHFTDKKVKAPGQDSAEASNCKT